MVTVSGMLGGVWMPVDNLGGVLLKICKCMPFYHGVYAARYAECGTSLIITLGFAVVFYAVCGYSQLYMYRRIGCRL